MSTATWVLHPELDRGAAYVETEGLVHPCVPWRRLRAGDHPDFVELADDSLRACAAGRAVALKTVREEFFGGPLRWATHVMVPVEVDGETRALVGATSFERGVTAGDLRRYLRLEGRRPTAERAVSLWEWCHDAKTVAAVLKTSRAQVQATLFGAWEVGVDLSRPGQPTRRRHGRP